MRAYLQVPEPRNPRLHGGAAGFTLVELLITVAILSILVSIAVPLVGDRLREARINVDETNVVLLQGAYDMYYRDHGEHPVSPAYPGDNAFYAFDTEHELVTAGYLREIPESPFGLDPGYIREGKKIESLAEGVYYNN